MIKRLALFAVLVLAACGDSGNGGADAGHVDPKPTPDAGQTGGYDGSIFPTDDASIPDDGGTVPAITFAQLEGPATAKVASGKTLDVTAVVYVAGLTDRDGQGEGISAEFGFGPAAADPSTFTWVAAKFDSDADGLATKANDRYKATLSLPDGVSVVAARFKCSGSGCSTNDWLIVDRNWNAPAFDSADALTVTVAPVAISWCSIISPPSATVQLGRGKLTSYGQVFADGLTSATGAASGIKAELGVGPAATDPRSATTWSWTPATFNKDFGNNDEYVADHTPSAAGSFAYAWRFTLGSGQPVYCDLDGNDTTPANGFDPAKLGSLTVTAPGIDFGKLESAATLSASSGTSTTVSALIYGAGITDAVGQGAGVTVEIGYGASGSDPLTHASWKWTAATYKEDVDGLSPADHANDRYDATFSAADGTWDVAARVKLTGGSFIALDLDGSTNGYQSAQASKLTVTMPAPKRLGYCELSSPLTASFQSGRGSVTVIGKVYGAGITDTTSGSAATGVTGEVGFGPKSSDPTSSTAWTWVTANYAQDVANDDEYHATINPSAVGSYAYAYRFSYGTQVVYCDSDGNDTTSGGFDAANLGALDVLAPAIDFGTLEGQDATLAHGASATVTALVYAKDITDRTGQGTGVTVEFGYGKAGSDPATDSTWIWTPGAYTADVDGLNANDKANDRWSATLAPADGSWDVAARAKLNNGAAVIIDTDGTTNGYQSAKALHLTVGNPPPAITFTQLQAVPSAENAGTRFFIAAEVYAKGLTDAVGQGAGITAELGIGARGTDPSTSTSWTFTSASYLSDAAGGGTNSNDVYGGWVTAAQAGQYDVVVRFKLNNATTYADTNGTTPFAVAELGHVDLFAAGSDIGFCNLQSPSSMQLTPGQSNVHAYGQLYVQGLTDTSSQAASGITGQLVYGPATTDPTKDAGWFEVGAGPTQGYNFGTNNDEYDAAFTAPGAGNYRYTFRFRRAAGWTYCDLDGNGSNSGLSFDPTKLGSMTVQ